MQLVKELYEAAQPFSPCRLFTGQETVKELMRVFKSPQGIEFCVKNDFPQDRFLPELKSLGLEIFDIFIDAGKRTVIDPENIVLVGDTEFTIKCGTLGHACRITLLKGARANIQASGYAVVTITSDEASRYECKVTDHAIVR